MAPDQIIAQMWSNGAQLVYHDRLTMEWTCMGEFMNMGYYLNLPQ